GAPRIDKRQRTAIKQPRTYETFFRKLLVLYERESNDAYGSARSARCRQRGIDDASLRNTSGVGAIGSTPRLCDELRGPGWLGGDRRRPCGHGDRRRRGFRSDPRG